MRRAMLAPMMLLLGATAVPPPPPVLPAPRWCGGDPADLAPADAPVVLLPGYGQGGFPIRTANPEAQAFFDNGMQLAHAFAHKAAIAAFQEARRRDPACAMCAWGEAWASGPTINYGVSAEDARKLADIVATAERLAAGGPMRERNLIGALRQRYPASGKGGDAAFAAAMEQMVALAPGDDEILTITADALMVAAGDNTNAETMARPVSLLETVLRRSPDFAPAIHFYIHATEGAGYPERAEPYADKLKAIAPAASHLVHMPSHTYYWIGRYADAATANVAAVGIDEKNAERLKLDGPDAVWKLSYHAHNVHFGIAGALMSGDAANGLALSRPLAAAAPQKPKMDDFRQTVTGLGYVAIAHFGGPEEMLGLAAPAAGNPIATALWRYARGEAFARQGDIRRLEAEARAIPSRAPGAFERFLTPLYSVNRLVLQGRAAMLGKHYDQARRLFEQAAAIEESKPMATFSDPPLFWYPVRRDIAALLLARGDAPGALAAADAALKLRPRDPVSLELRARAQAKLGNPAAARHDRAAAIAGWRGQRSPLG